MSRKIYIILLLLTVIITLMAYYFKAQFSNTTILISLFVLSMLFIGSVHGIIAHSMRPEKKGDLILYPILMGALFGLMFLFWVFVLFPAFCPDFLGNLL